MKTIRNAHDHTIHTILKTYPHENVELFLTGTIVSASSVRYHPKNQYTTRSNKKSSPLVVFTGKSSVLELIAHYVIGTQQQLRTFCQLMGSLPTLTEDVLVVKEDKDKDDY